MATRRYLDAGGRAPVHPVAQEAFLAALEQGWADPRRLHAEGRRARLLLDGAREALAEMLGARTEEIHLTAGHTASLHAAVAAVARARRRAGGRVVVSAVERAAVLAAATLAGDEIVTVPVDRTGRLDLRAWQDAVGPGVALAALQHANGEVGTLQPVAAAFEATARAGVPLLVDAGASVGHVDVAANWDVLAADPSDWGGIAGVGVLAVRSRVRTTPTGPEDEDPWAPGGVSVPAAVAAAASLRAELDRLGFAVGSGSACTSSSLQPSHVLAAMGVLTHGNVRIALPSTVTADDVEAFCAVLPQAVAEVRRMAGATDL